LFIILKTKVELNIVSKTLVVKPDSQINLGDYAVKSSTLL